MSRRLSDLEKRIIEVLESVGEEGLIQRELWNLLGVDSRSGMRVVARLERRGLLTRKRIYHKGKATYLLRLSKKAGKEIEIPRILTAIPCFSCPYLDRCDEGGSPDPRNCIELDKWLRNMKLKYAEGNFE